MSEKNKWTLPPGALQPHFCPIFALFALGRQMGVPTYFFRSLGRLDDFT